MENNKTEKKKHELDMTKGSPMKILIQFSIPLLLGNLFQQLYNTVDSIIVGNFVGTQALAAVGAGFPLMLLLASAYFGFGMAGTIMVSQFYGAKRYDKVQLSATTIYKSLLLLSIPLSVFGFFAAEPILRFINIPDDGTLASATLYLKIIFASMIGTVGFNLNAGFLQGLGDSVSSVRFLIIAAVINTILDLVFVIPLKMGVAGAALATVIAQWVSWIIGIFYINRSYKILHINLLHLDFDKSLFRESMQLGIPTAIQNSLFSLGALAFEAIINSNGTAYIAGFNSASKVDTFIFLPVQSFSNAMTTYTGQNFGGRRMDRIVQGRNAGLIISIVFSVVVGLIMMPFTAASMRLFTDDPKVIQVGVWYLNSMLPFYTILSVLFIQNGILRGVGKVTFPMVTSFISLWGARVPAGYLLQNTLGPKYLFLAYPIGWLAGALVSSIYYYFGKWKSEVERKIKNNELSNSSAYPNEEWSVEEDN